MRWVALLAVVLLTAAAVLWSRSGPDAEGETGPPREVLLITIDTMRADAVGEGTPALDGFLEQATRFAAARAPVPLTLPSHLTMLSGLDPVDHGVHDNAAPPLPRERGFPLVAEEFAERGYLTAAFVACAVLGPQTGIDAGFTTFECPPYGERFSGDAGDLPAEERVQGALAWLGSLPERQPWFLWVHFFDPHDPYEPWTGDARRRGTSNADGAAKLYAGEVRRADAAIERLLAAVGEDALVVIASDHGEGLGEHGEPTHGNLCYSTTMDVFLAARGPGFERGAVDRRPRSLRTVADLLRGRVPPADEVVTGESLLANRTHGWGQVFCAFDGRHALVETGPRVELFDRRDDPAERTPLDPADVVAYRRLDLAIRALRKGGSHGDEEFIPDSASPYGTARRPVSSYLSRRENRELADPAAGFAYTAKVNAAKRLLYAARRSSNPEFLDRAVRNLTDLMNEDSNSPMAPYYLAHALAARAALSGAEADHVAAANVALEAIRRGYRVAPVLYLLLSESLASKNTKALHAALDAAVGVRIVPDLNSAERLVEIALALDDEARRQAANYLERFSKSANLPSDRRRFLELLEKLR